MTTIKPSSKLVFFCACMGMLLFGIALITLGSVAELLRNRFQMDAITAGTVFSILPIGILVGSLVFGPFADRYGYKIILLLSCLLISAGLEGIAYAGTLGVLKACVFLFGWGGGMINGATNAVVSDISASNKGANLSLLGVFYAIGALGMPSVLGVLRTLYPADVVLAVVGCIPLAVAVLCILTRFPKAKQAAGVPFGQGLRLLREEVLIAIGFFLFCVSSFEAIINNWTTTYLSTRLSVADSTALYALSLYVAGMAAMRLLLGSVFRRTSSWRILGVSFIFLLGGVLLLHLASNFSVAVAGLVLVGIGLAAGFPVMLGFVGSLYQTTSATAFSIVLTIALVGNMLVNLTMGVIASRYGIAHLTTVAFVLLSAMLLLSTLILKQTKLQHT